MHYKKLFIVILISFISVSQLLAERQDALVKQIEKLQSTLSYSLVLRLTSQGENDTVAIVNDSVVNQLERILRQPAMIKHDPARLLNLPGLESTGARDKRLSIFSLYENTGGSFRSNLNVIYYRTATNKPIAVHGGTTEDNSRQPEFYSYGASYDTIYKLPVSGRDVYLCMGGGIACNTCVYNVAYVLEIVGDSLNFEYPAFPTTKTVNGETQQSYSPSYHLNARHGDIHKFAFDPKTQTLQVAYTPDDLNRGPTLQDTTLKESFVFDGKHFREAK